MDVTKLHCGRTSLLGSACSTAFFAWIGCACFYHAVAFLLAARLRCTLHTTHTAQAVAAAAAARR